MVCVLSSVVAAAMLRGCGPGSPAPKAVPSGPGEVAIVFRLGGDDFADEPELSEARALGRKVEGTGLGRLVSWSTGMGKIELRFSVADGRTAPARIEALLRSERPPWKFSVERGVDAARPTPGR